MKILSSGHNIFDTEKWLKNKWPPEWMEKKMKYKVRKGYFVNICDFENEVLTQKI